MDYRLKKSWQGFWESDSAQICIDYLRANNFAESAKWPLLTEYILK